MHSAEITPDVEGFMPDRSLCYPDSADLHCSTDSGEQVNTFISGGFFHVMRRELLTRMLVHVYILSLHILIMYTGIWITRFHNVPCKNYILNMIKTGISFKTGILWTSLLGKDLVFDWAAPTGGFSIPSLCVGMLSYWTEDFLNSDNFNPFQLKWHIQNGIIIWLLLFMIVTWV